MCGGSICIRFMCLGDFMCSMFVFMLVSSSEVNGFGNRVEKFSIFNDDNGFFMFFFLGCWVLVGIVC